MPNARKFDHDEAKRRHHAGEPVAALAREYGVSEQSVSQAIKRAGGTVTRLAGAPSPATATTPASPSLRSPAARTPREPGTPRHIKPFPDDEKCSVERCLQTATNRLTFAMYGHKIHLSAKGAKALEAHGAPVCVTHYGAATLRYPCATPACSNPAQKREQCGACQDAGVAPAIPPIEGKPLTADQVADLERAGAAEREAREQRELEERAERLITEARELREAGQLVDPTPDPLEEGDDEALAASADADGSGEGYSDQELAAIVDEHDAEQATPDPTPTPRPRVELIDILTHATLGILGPIGTDLRQRGWDAQLMVTELDPADGMYRWKVSVDVELAVRVPIEATTA
jgi:hypothetical protein